MHLNRQQRAESGFSMIEVLIAIVVISVGFLSMLALQINTLSNLSQNNQTTLAMNLASGMSERLRANRGNANFYHNANTSTFTKDCTVAGACTLIERDIWEFRTSIVSETAMVNGVGTITIAAGLADITISWTDKQGTLNNYVMQVPL